MIPTDKEKGSEQDEDELDLWLLICPKPCPFGTVGITPAIHGVGFGRRFLYGRMRKEYERMLLTEFDPERSAIINPEDCYAPAADFPETAVAVFSGKLFQSLAQALRGRKIAENRDVDGAWPVYEVNYRGTRFAWCKGRLGAPACVGHFEEIIARGVKRIILMGNCGVLDRSIPDCGIIIPTLAFRDEGTSYHYCPPSDTIPVNKKYIPEFKRVLERLGYSYVEGATWTTDAFYRETKAKMEARKAAGAICVEMECAAMQAMCDFRGAEFFQFFYAGDNLDHPSWDPRSLPESSRLDEKERIVLLAMELACEIEKGAK